MESKDIRNTRIDFTISVFMNYEAEPSMEDINKVKARIEKAIPKDLEPEIAFEYCEFEECGNVQLLDDDDDKLED